MKWHAAAVLTALAVAVVAAGSAAGAAAGESSPPAFAELLRLLAERRHGHVSYTEVQQLAMLERPLESSGELLYDAPDRLEKRTLKPRPETLLLEHGVLSARRGRHSYRLEVSAYPQVAPLVESIRATLAGDRATLERLFRVQFDGSLEHWTLTLAPLDAALARVVRDIRIAGERDAVRTVEIRQQDGDRSLLSLGPELTP
jgi:hypothetical protein